MVDISSGDKKINITVSSSGNKASVNATPDTAMYYSNKSREWAISDKIVSNEDYSSKYYANVSKQNADKSTVNLENLTTNYNQYKNELENTKNISVEEIETAKTNAISDITNQETLSVDNVNTAGETQVNLAKEQATIATTQAGIATAKTSEVVESGNAAITAITEQETTSKNNVETKGTEQIELIQNEGATQIANVQSTGFYMRDDKLYFINSQGEETEFKSGGSGLEVCDIGMALYVDETKGLRRYLNGQIVDINTNTQAFLNRLKEITTLHPSLLCTEDEWQTAKTMSAFGQVGKFVFNYSGGDIVSVRVPRVVNVQGLFDLQNLGMTVSAGLPNIEGSFRGVYTPNEIVYTGAFLNSTGGSQYFGTSGTNVDCTVTFDASRSSEIYGNSNTVQPEAIQYPYFIQIATGAETEANITNKFENTNPQTLFESKYSEKPLYNESWLLSNGQWNAKAVYPTAYEGLQVEYNSEIEVGTTVTLPSGVNYTKRGLSVKLSTEEYTDYDFVLNTAEETFRLPLKTKLASGNAVVGNAPIKLDYYDYDGIYRGEAGYLGKIESDIQNPLCTRGSVVSNASNFSASSDPTKSGLELSDSNLYLYFYVGETVQNANLIDAGRIGEALANKQDKCIHIIDTYENGTSGYRVWSDGYCEQWGYISQTSSAWTTVNFLKPYRDKNYSVTSTLNVSDTANARNAAINVYIATNTQCLITCYGVAAEMTWKAGGYLVEGEY